MGYVQVRTSDISGEVLTDGSVVEVIVRDHPALTEAKRLDVSSKEAEKFKSAGEIVSVELRLPNGKTRKVMMERTAFDKLVLPSILALAAGLRGRRPGYSPKKS